jgi:hypothetical protein
MAGRQSRTAHLPIKAGPAVLLSKGMGLKAGNKPMASYTRRPGERHGHNWYIPNVSRSSEFRHVAFDANSWKTFVHEWRSKPAKSACDEVSQIDNPRPA